MLMTSLRGFAKLEGQVPRLPRLLALRPRGILALAMSPIP